MKKMRMESVDMTAQNIDKIAALFPNCMTETIDEQGKPKRAINFELLKQMLSDDVIEGDEAYEFTWVGKKAAIVEANKPIRKTLRPCPEESKNWDTTENLYIEGDNLEVLKLLQESYLGKVKMIYIDPPYNTGKNFIYRDDFDMTLDEYAEESGQLDEETGYRLFKNTDTNGRFHSEWCSMIYSRLTLARNLLSDDGVIFISIDDHEQENLKKICDEVLGTSCFVDCITWNKRVPKNDNKGIGNIHEYILVYTNSQTSTRQFTMLKDGIDEVFEFISDLKKKNVPIPIAETELKQFYSKKGFDRGITLYCNLDSEYRPWGKINLSWPNADTFGPRYDVIHPKTKKATKVPDRGWRWNRETFDSQLNYNNVQERYDGSYVCGSIWFAKDENTQPSSIKYLKDVSKMLLRSILSLKSDGGIEVEKIFDGKSFFTYPKPTSLLKVLIDSLEEKDGIFMDFFSGSATTAHAVMQLNAEDGGKRKFIMVQLPETCDLTDEAAKAGYKNICEIGKERIRRAGAKILSEQLSVNSDQRAVSSELRTVVSEQLSVVSEQLSVVSEQLSVVSEQLSVVSGQRAVGRGGRAVDSGGSDKPACRTLFSDVSQNTDTCPLPTSHLDTGFRVFKLDDTNMKDVYYSPDALDQKLLTDLVSNIKEDRNDLDLLFGCLLDWGLPLSMPYTSEKIEGCTVHTYNDGDLIACFDENIPESVITTIAKRKPLRAVFRDASFANSPAKINVFEIFKLYMPEDANDITKRVRVL